MNLKTKRAKLLREATALKQADGTFENDEVRASFDAKMSEIEAIDVQLRAADAEEPPVPVDADVVRKQAVEDERKRATDIRSAVTIAKLDATVADDMVKRGLSVDAARA